jgi:hypothetical protein
MNTHHYFFKLTSVFPANNNLTISISDLILTGQYKGIDLGLLFKLTYINHYTKII